LIGPFVRVIIFRKKAYKRNFEQITEELQASCMFQPAIHPKITINGLLGKCNWLSQ
jgi:hypothetical protein